MKTDLLPGELTISTGDTHVYTDHIEPLKKQLERNPHSEPKLFLDSSIKDKDFKDITIDDFFLLGYFPEPTIKMKMAI